MTTPWKVLYASAAGTSHEREGEPCQDYALGRILDPGGMESLILACSDGAGSCRYAALGARLASTTLVREAAAALEGGLDVSEIDRGLLLRWCDRAHRALALEACVRNTGTEEFGCTLAFAVVGARSAVFAQIGDGAIVVHQGDDYRPVFWPQSGEFAGTTFFLTSRGVEDRMAFASAVGSVDELALLTDGLQPLALHYATRSVHGPFFAPMFDALRRTQAAHELEAPLKQFLTSRPVNDRTDDDKTLILATRRPPDDERP